MLVLSRKENQTIHFPNLGVSIEILRVESNRVRVGIDAPKDVRILRGELGPDSKPADESHDDSDADSRQRNHDLRNRLNSASLAMHLLQKQLDAGLIGDAEQTLSRALQTFAELDRLAAGEDVKPIAKQKGKGQRALVVDDNANERELLAGYLRLCGFEVDTVQDGIDAMLYLAKHEQRPDIILLDMQMPRMDGPNTIDAIRSNPEYRDIKIFAVSGSERDALGVSIGHDVGVDRWFAKPLQPAAFAEEIGRECTTA